MPLLLAPSPPRALAVLGLLALTWPLLRTRASVARAEPVALTAPSARAPVVVVEAALMADEPPSPVASAEPPRRTPAELLSALVEGKTEGMPIGRTTPLELEEMGKLLGEAHRELYGVLPGPERWLIAWAHAAHEVSRGRTCLENNFGNAVVSLRWRGDWHLRRVAEQTNRATGKWALQQVRFRSYATPREGALDYWRVLTGNFGSALPFFDGGDARGAGRLLCERGYSTSGCDGYGQGIRGLYAELKAAYGHRLRELVEPAQR